MAGAMLLLVGCTGSGPVQLDDDQKVVRAVLVLLAKAGPVCVDRTTRGDTLFAYREMLQATRPARVALAWHQPLPLRPPPALTDRDMARDQFRSERVRIEEPDADAVALPIVQQTMLNGSAGRLAQMLDAPSAVSIGAAWAPPGVAARWWPLNRIRSDCTPNYMLMTPVRTRTLAFVGVSADHWGTIYAFQRRGADWVPAARWTSWLY